MQLDTVVTMVVIINILIITRNLFNEWNLMNGKINIFRSHDTDLYILINYSLRQDSLQIPPIHYWTNGFFLHDAVLG